MLEVDKQKIIAAVRAHIDVMRKKILAAVQLRDSKSGTMSRDARGMSPGDALAARRLLAHNQEQAENLRQLYPSPYFTKCVFLINGEEKTMYFGKFSFSEEKIYSWITPAAALRFENPGPASYARPDGKVQAGTLLGKDQYMIVDGKLLFLSTEGVGQPRELLYQEHFTRQKSGFILPEVVEQMEKAQDQVVRAHYEGPFVISGPAGSGKTTLALHRVAYLAQSPETAEYFTPETILVLVQDTGTKDYFSHLLPELGIRGVTIETFAEWAGKIIETEFTYVTRYGETEREKNMYEYAKLLTLKNALTVPYSKNIFSVLSKVYEITFGVEQKKLWDRQKKERALDRFDITLLLRAYQTTRGPFEVSKEYYEESAGGSYRKRNLSFAVKYNLLIVDEFQNYLPEQLQLLKSCLNKRLESVVYVGDLAQQTQLGTIKEWGDIGETVQPERLVKLQKVYRNTKQILEYINRRGYQVTIPSGIKEGPVVVEKTLNTDEELAYVKTVATRITGSLGILAPDKNYLEKYKKQFAEQKNIFCLSFQEAQGVEFDAVILLGTTLSPDAQNLPTALQTEVLKVQRDLLYVALTRAMTELHVLL